MNRSLSPSSISTVLFSLWKCQGKLFLPKASSEQLKTLTRQPLLLVLSPLLHTNINLPHTARTCSQHRLDIDPRSLIQTWKHTGLRGLLCQLSSITKKNVETKATCYCVAPLSVCFWLPPVSHTPFFITAFSPPFFPHSIHSCTEVVVPDASLHGWGRV